MPFPRQALYWTLLGLILGGVFFFGDLVAGLTPNPRDLLWMGVFCAWIWALVRPLIAWFGERFPLDGQLRVSRLTVHLSASLLVGLVLSLVMVVLFWWAYGILGRPSPFRYLRMVVTQYFFLAEVLFYWTVITVGEAQRYLARWQSEKVRLAETREKLAEARLAALRGQVKPHFLFNTLNGLSALIRMDAKRDALDTIVNLADLLRSTLADDDREFWSLADEIAFVRRYLDIEARRFGDRLRFRVETIPNAGTIAIPRFLLQPLVENAIHHGLEADPEARQITLEAWREDDGLVIAVENDGPNPPENWRQRARSRVGLENLHARLELWNVRETSLELKARNGGGARAILNLPEVRL